MLCGLTWLASLDGWPDILGGTGRPSIQSSTRSGVTGIAWGLALPFPLFSSSARPPENRSPTAGFIGEFHGRELHGGRGSVPGGGESLSSRESTDPPLGRSEERRVGKESVRTCRSRWSPIS